MKTLFFLPVLLISVVSMFGQSVSEEEKAKWQTPEYQEAIQVAQDFSKKFDSENFDSAESMMRPLNQGVETQPAAARPKVKEYRIKAFREYFDKQAEYGDITNKEVASIWKRNDEYYPDNVVFYDIEIRYTRSGKPKGKSINVTVMKKDGELVVERFNNTR